MPYHKHPLDQTRFSMYVTLASWQINTPRHTWMLKAQLLEKREEVPLTAGLCKISSIFLTSKSAGDFPDSMNGQINTDELTRILIHRGLHCFANQGFNLQFWTNASSLQPVPHAASHFLPNLLYVSFLKTDFPFPRHFFLLLISASVSLSLSVCFRIQRSGRALIGSASTLFCPLLFTPGIKQRQQPEP